MEESPAGKRYPSYVEELQARTEAAENKLKERISQLDSENQAFRERFKRESERQLEQQRMQLVESCIEGVDNFERALGTTDSSSEEAFREGIELNLGLFRTKLTDLGVEPLDVLNQPYDPENAEAVSTVAVESPSQDGCVVEVLQRGYRFGDRLLRPARVIVGKVHPGQDQPG